MWHGHSWIMSVAMDYGMCHGQDPMLNGRWRGWAYGKIEEAKRIKLGSLKASPFVFLKKHWVLSFLAMGISPYGPWHMANFQAQWNRKQAGKNSKKRLPRISHCLQTHSNAHTQLQLFSLQLSSFPSLHTTHKHGDTHKHRHRHRLCVHHYSLKIVHSHNNQIDNEFVKDLFRKYIAAKCTATTTCGNQQARCTCKILFCMSN